MLGQRRRLTRTAVADARRRAEDRYWDVYQRTVMPGELLALCFVGATISIGVAVSFFAFMPW
ncbi:MULTISPECIES: hypothetical protein [unclassified Pseudoclavibacter]|jgi:hypothetical protein|uniref:hypothetical protein n=1 Tax=unclassified Pseudoclavibacter TaxID=2615177 RepID=UPI0011B053E5|nr:MULTISPECIES: hypothetical protein [unclassified Pseudoclavibacter]MBS3180289.1 hypothetical protein [Pseudoclavibacter sp. Marseille-Q4354]